MRFRVILTRVEVRDTFILSIPGCILEQLCDLTSDSGNYHVRSSYSDRSGLVRGARALLSSVTRVLLIADTVIVKQLLTTKDRVSIVTNSLNHAHDWKQANYFH